MVSLWVSEDVVYLLMSGQSKARKDYHYLDGIDYKHRVDITESFVFCGAALCF